MPRTTTTPAPASSATAVGGSGRFSGGGAGVNARGGAAAGEIGAPSAPTGAGGAGVGGGTELDGGAALAGGAGAGGAAAADILDSPASTSDVTPMDLGVHRGHSLYAGGTSLPHFGQIQVNIRYLL